MQERRPPHLGRETCETCEIWDFLSLKITARNLFVLVSFVLEILNYIFHYYFHLCKLSLRRSRSCRRQGGGPATTSPGGWGSRPAPGGGHCNQSHHLFDQRWRYHRTTRHTPALATLPHSHCCQSNFSMTTLRFLHLIVGKFTLYCSNLQLMVVHYGQELPLLSATFYFALRIASAGPRPARLKCLCDNPLSRMTE